jgi:hypothetical protein
MPQVKVVDGVRSWVIEGDKVLVKGAIPSSTIKRDGSKWPGLEFINDQIEEVHPSSYDVHERVKIMDACGVTPPSSTTFVSKSD